jgi:putative heme uptake system protein
VDSSAEPRVTYLVIDGENLDATLGISVLGHRPAPDERPRWERVLGYAQSVWGQPVKALFFLNATSGSLPMPFVQALLAMGFRPVPLAGPPGMKVVDVGIQRMLDAIGGVDADVVLGSHDGDFRPQVEALLGGGRRVALLGFREYVNSGYADLAAAGLQVLDLEHDAKAFTKPLPRVRILDIEAFDPTAFL